MKPKSIYDLTDRLKSTHYFNENEYFSKYIRLIINNLDTVKEKRVTQSHHIIPRAYFIENNLEVDNTSYNLVNLRFVDHILAHYYLCKCCSTDKARQDNGLAVYLMSSYHPEQFKELSQNTFILQETYELSKQKMSQIHKSKILSEQQRIEISERTKGENNPMYGTSRPDISKFNSITKKNNKYMLGKHHSEETKTKLCKNLKGKALNKIWINNGIEEHMIHKDDFEGYLSKGYYRGRLPSSITPAAKANIGKHQGKDNVSNRLDVKEKIRRKQTGKRIYNNGIVSKWFSPEENIPEGFIPGFCKK